MSDPAAAEEALRQQRLLAALRGDAPLDTLSAWLRDTAPRARRGLQAYAANAGALAERALAAAFPTLAQLVGVAAFNALARAFWQAHPPVRGDVAQWGDALPGFIATDPQLAGEPSLADVARLDWAVRQAEQAGDAGEPAIGLDRLAAEDADGLWLHLAEGTALLSCADPVATIWLAHRSTAADRFAPVREAFARGVGEHALVWRHGYRAQVSALSDAAAAFTQAVLAGLALGPAMDEAGPDFAFEPWLLTALQQGWLAAVDTQPLDHQEPAPCATQTESQPP